MKNNEEVKEGFAGYLARAFIQSKLTLLIAVASLLLGLMAITLTPKEEEPQISVPMIDIQTAAPGLNAHEIQKSVTEVIERGVWGLDGVEYVYSSSMDHGSLVTVRFKVGEPMEPSLVKIHHKLLGLKSELPRNAMPSSVKSFSIDDVPFLVLTFSSETLSDFELRTLVAPLTRELSSTPELSNVELLGGLKRTIRVRLDANKIKSNGANIGMIAKSLSDNGYLIPVAKNWSSKEVLDVEVGARLKTKKDVENISVGSSGGRIVRLKDVASIIDGPEERTKISSILFKDQGVKEEAAVSIAFSKRKGTNVVVLAKNLISRATLFAKDLPSDIRMTVVRDYGSTAHDKSKELIEHLFLATFSVAILIAIIMGIRASLVVAIAIPVTLALTLAIYYFMGYTLNRVTLFALIFSIGILVDDAIVVVENIERHLALDKKLGLLKTTIKAVSEVGNPTILATIAVIAAILPMAFVRGLMGPYMLPIPVGASVAMILSLLVAFIVTPWAAVKILKADHSSVEGTNQKKSKLDQLYEKVMNWFFIKKTHSAYFIFFSVLLLVLSIGLVFTKSVKVKMLPFDNKEEFQVLLDFPTSTPLMVNHEKTKVLAKKLLENPQVEKVQIFSGEPAPFSFSGMVKHTFMRKQDYQSDLQIVLKNKKERDISSHDIIQSLRSSITDFSKTYNVVSKVLEIPPGPPVMATIVAEVYGPSEEVRRSATLEIEKIFRGVDSLVDIDTTLRLGRSKLIIPFDYEKGSRLGVSAKDFSEQAAILFMEAPLALLEDVKSPEEVNIVLSFSDERRESTNPLQDIYVPSYQAGIVELGKLNKDSLIKENIVLNRKNLKPVEYIMAEMTGLEEAPVYGILDLTPKIKYPLQTAAVPWNTKDVVVKWDGEWFITYEVFRDMGFAFAVVLVLIYVLVVGWFKSFTVPLIIMAPIPISLIGILPGHAIFNSYFTATSMIGFIAGAGIIVRNSIILVDFIEHQMEQGLSLHESVISAGVLRFRPMLLTAAAVVVGSSVMLFDPIFQGLAISLIFGEVAATVLSRFAVPILYYWIVGNNRIKYIQNKIDA